MKKYKVINARAKSQIGKELNFNAKLIENADRRNSCKRTGLEHLMAFEVTNSITLRVFEKFEMYQYEGDGGEWFVKFTAKGGGSTWYVVEEITEEPKEKLNGMRILKPVAPANYITVTEPTDCIINVEEITDENVGKYVSEDVSGEVIHPFTGEVFPWVMVDYTPDGYVTLQYFDKEGVRRSRIVVRRLGSKMSVKREIKEGNSSAFSAVVFETARGKLLHICTSGCKLYQSKEFVEFDGLRYKIAGWAWREASAELIYQCELNHKL